MLHALIYCNAFDIIFDAILALIIASTINLLIFFDIQYVLLIVTIPRTGQDILSVHSPPQVCDP